MDLSKWVDLCRRVDLYQRVGLGKETGSTICRPALAGQR
ncbi:hypothetical protein SAMN05428945_2180 [Streptomyces sp. 2224.1]|nr:hypothetical protein BX261_3127 [Streptomyces sp. 2321.6]SDR44314.1 hypothetical protein SAMN05216511_4073 [Streptomyces sp. KS_16]SEC15558.1 hypothetical protein SAMN05428945_2180 [Streptomyces sp. 2224.1]SNC69275.1 hypothetical protein SAMN06272741_3123 [Streptomyces sp. 2114.4]